MNAVRFPAWLRANAEHYLLVAAQQRVARRHGMPAPSPPMTLKDRGFLTFFVPIYRRLPWGLRRTVLQLMPGSHRRTWAPRERKPLGPAV